MLFYYHDILDHLNSRSIELTAKIKFIINPKAAGGNALKSWNKSKKVIESFFPQYDFEITKSRRQATKITQEALINDYETIVAFGGDGTLNEVINGFYHSGNLINPKARLAVISIGTGGDFGRMMNFSQKVEVACELIKNGKTKKCNVGLVSCSNEKGEKNQRYFINIAEAGFGAETVRLINQNETINYRRLVYLKGLLRTVATYQNKNMEIEVDGSLIHSGKTLVAIVANGQYFGGGMHITPNAKIDDGMFEIVILGDLGKFNIIRNIYCLYNGTIATHPQVKCVRGREIKISSSEKVLIELDGDYVGCSPVTFNVQPQSINLVC